jgi:hypothetical protein
MKTVLSARRLCEYVSCGYYRGEYEGRIGEFVMLLSTFWLKWIFGLIERRVPFYRDINNHISTINPSFQYKERENWRGMMQLHAL